MRINAKHFLHFFLYEKLLILHNLKNTLLIVNNEYIFILNIIYKLKGFYELSNY